MKNRGKNKSVAFIILFSVYTYTCTYIFLFSLSKMFFSPTQIAWHYIIIILPVSKSGYEETHLWMKRYCKCFQDLNQIGYLYLIPSLWATDHYQPLRIFAGHLADVTCTRFHPNSNYVATGSTDRTIRLWDVLNGNCVRIFAGHKVLKASKGHWMKWALDRKSHSSHLYLN